MSTDAASTERSFASWTPVHIFQHRPQPEVLWSRLGVQRFDDPFFAQTVTAALQLPLARLLQRTTSLDELVAASEREPAVEPAGFIFHVTRCGSTLVSQMFARMPRVISISEAQPLTAVAEAPQLSQEDRRRAFRALIRLYGRKVNGGEIGSVFKFSPRETLAWRAIVEIFPQVPRIVLHRDPAEVLVSNLGQVSEIALPGIVQPAALGTPPRPLATNEDYAAFVFSRIFAHAAEVARVQGSLTVNYTDLPGAVESLIAPHFGIALDDADRAAMREAARLYAKDATRTAMFAPDSAAKQAEADASILEHIAKWFEASYRELRALTEASRHPG